MILGVWKNRQKRPFLTPFFITFFAIFWPFFAIFPFRIGHGILTPWKVVLTVFGPQKWPFSFWNWKTPVFFALRKNKNRHFWVFFTFLKVTGAIALENRPSFFMVIFEPVQKWPFFRGNRSLWIRYRYFLCFFLKKWFFSSKNEIFCHFFVIFWPFFVIFPFRIGHALKMTPKNDPFWPPFLHFYCPLFCSIRLFLAVLLKRSIFVPFFEVALFSTFFVIFYHFLNLTLENTLEMTFYRFLGVPQKWPFFDVFWRFLTVFWSFVNPFFNPFFTILAYFLGDFWKVGV